MPGEGSCRGNGGQLKFSHCLGVTAARVKLKSKTLAQKAEVCPFCFGRKGWLSIKAGAGSCSQSPAVQLCHQQCCRLLGFKCQTIPDFSPQTSFLEITQVASAGSGVAKISNIQPHLNFHQQHHISKCKFLLPVLPTATLSNHGP